MVATLRARWLDWLVVIVLLGLFGVAVGGSRAAYTETLFPVGWQAWWDGFLQNSGTEMLGAFLTFVLLEVIRGGREKKAQEEAEERRTKEVKALMRDFVQAQEIARLRAAKSLEERQSILDSMKATGLLQGAYLRKVDLRGAALRGANLEGADLVGANLPAVDLGGANLQGAHLGVANLRGIDLHGANLQGAHLAGAELQGAVLSWANLQGARLEHPALGKAEFNEETILPDGTKWTPDTDMTRFTQPGSQEDDGRA